MAINVDLADSAAIDPNRNNNFGLRFERACEIPWIGCDIFNNDGVALSNGCTANPLCDRNSHVLCRRAAEGPKHKDVRFVGIQHVEAGPVVMWQALDDARYAEFLQLGKILGSVSELVNIRQNPLKIKNTHLDNPGIDCRTLRSE